MSESVVEETCQPRQVADMCVSEFGVGWAKWKLEDGESICPLLGSHVRVSALSFFGLRVDDVAGLFLAREYECVA